MNGLLIFSMDWLIKHNQQRNFSINSFTGFHVSSSNDFNNSMVVIWWWNNDHRVPYIDIGLTPSNPLGIGRFKEHQITLTQLYINFINCLLFKGIRT